jgi:GntR family transcriptional regulator
VAQIYRYRELAAALRQEIVSGQLTPGNRLPSELRLVEQFKVSRVTVREATRLLVSEGLVERVPGRKGGMVVRERATLIFRAGTVGQFAAPQSETALWRADVLAQGLQPSQRVECRMVELPDEVASRLGEPAGATAVLRRCVRLINDRPSSIHDSYYPRWLFEEVPELLSPSEIPGGADVLLAERGHVQVGYVDHNSARMPAPDETDVLQIGPGTPVLVSVRAGATSARVVRVTVEVRVDSVAEYELGDVRGIPREARPHDQDR